jgi:hypothetical protein
LGRGNQGGERNERQEFRAPAGNPNGAQLEAISVKLDKIIRLLEPKIAPKVEVSTEAPVEVVTNEDPETSSGPKKAKKTAKKGAIKK